LRIIKGKEIRKYIQGHLTDLLKWQKGGIMHQLQRCAWGAVLVIVFSIAGCITLPGKEPTIQAPQEAAVQEPTHTLPPSPIPATPTTAPSATPAATITPTITPTPTLTPIPGWSEVSGKGVSLWLPDTWRGGSPLEDLNQLLADAEREPITVQQYAVMLENNRGAINLWAYDTLSTGSPHLANIHIGQEEVGEAVTVEIYIDAINRNLPDHFTVTGWQLLNIQDLPGGKIFIDVDVNGLLIQEVMYILKDDNIMWLVTFAAASDAFPLQLAIIDQSVETLKIEESGE
jgi:hypothetical protein